MSTISNLSGQKELSKKSSPLMFPNKHCDITKLILIETTKARQKTIGLYPNFINRMLQKNMYIDK